jgi:predicted patatin/cPLA2 family phospholipase
VKQKVVLCLDGGAMSGVFGAGVVRKLQDSNIYDQLKAIHAVSAGVFNAAYFLARQTGNGEESVYLDYLAKDFVSSKKFFPGLIQQFINRFFCKISPDKILNTIDVDYVMKIIEKKIPLKVDFIKKQSIPFYIKLLNIESRETEYLLAQNHSIFKLLRASACMAPYTFASQKINNKHYLDGTIGESTGLRKLVEKYPESKIIYISNNKEPKALPCFIKAFFAGSITSLMYGKDFFRVFINREKKTKKDLLFAKSSSNILIIRPPENSLAKPRTKNREILQETYEMGRREGQKVLDFLKV